MLILELVTILLVALAAALAVAHALELPGKLRLDRETYRAVQTIYYPGFTYAGVSEIFAALAVLALILIERPGGARLALLVTALVLLALMHAAYWVVTHPVNRFWTEEVRLDSFSARFFGFDPAGRRGPRSREGDADALWRSARNRWEGSHVLRAMLGSAALVLLLLALLTGPRPG